MSIVSACHYKRAKDRLPQIMAKKHSSRASKHLLSCREHRRISLLAPSLQIITCRATRNLYARIAFFSTVVLCWPFTLTSAFDFSKPKRKLSNDPMKKFKSDAVQFAHFYIPTSCHHESSNSKELFQPFNHFYCIYLVLLCWIFENWNGTKQSQEENNCSWRLCRRYESPRRVNPRYPSW